MKAFTLPLLIAAMACPCFGQSQDPFEPAPDKEAAEETDSAAFFGGEGPIDLKSLRGKPVKQLGLLGCDDLTDISSVAGLKLEDVMLWKINVADITPLAGMPIKKLVIFGCPVKDLSPLKGMPLESLWVGATHVTDFAPLKGLLLKSLLLFCPEVDDISPLKGMPLEYLLLDCPKVKDISALHGMPLHTLFIRGTNVRDVSPLEGLPLEDLFVDIDRIDEGIKVLKCMKRLQRINNHDVEQVWNEYAKPIVLTRAEACADADLVAMGTIGEPGDLPVTYSAEEPRPVWVGRFTRSATMKDFRILLGDAPGNLSIYGGRVPGGTGLPS